MGTGGGGKRHCLCRGALLPRIRKQHPLVKCCMCSTQRVLLRTMCKQYYTVQCAKCTAAYDVQRVLGAGAEEDPLGDDEAPDWDHHAVWRPWAAEYDPVGELFTAMQSRNNHMLLSPPAPLANSTPPLKPLAVTISACGVPASLPGVCCAPGLAAPLWPTVSAAVQSHLVPPAPESSPAARWMLESCPLSFSFGWACRLPGAGCGPPVPIPSCRHVSRGGSSGCWRPLRRWLLLP